MEEVAEKVVEAGVTVAVRVAVVAVAVAEAVAVDVTLVLRVASVVAVAEVPASSCEVDDVTAADVDVPVCVPVCVPTVVVEVLETSQTSMSCSPLLGKLIPT